MYILMIETATDVGAVALYQNEKLLGTIEYHKPKTHSSLLAQMIQTLLRDMEVDTKQLNAVAVSKGPGSYTGLRVGVSTAKGLCMALDIPLMSVGSLEAMAIQNQYLAQSQNALICPMIDARRMEVYCAVFNKELQMVESTTAKIIDNHSFSDLLSDNKILFMGDGAGKCQSVLTHENALIYPEITSKSSGLGKVLSEKYHQSQFEDLLAFEPFYLKDYVATQAKKLI